MRKHALRYLLLGILGLVAFGCNSTDTIEPPPVPGTLPIPHPGYTFPHVDLANGVIPLPNNLLLNPQTGLVNLPGGTDDGVDSTVNAANSLNGFSTTGPIVIPFRGTVVHESVTQDTLPIYNAVTGQPVLARYNVEDSDTGSVVTVIPVRPLDPGTTHIVVLTRGIISALSNTPILSDNVINFIQQPTSLVDGAGNSTSRLLTNEQAQTLEPVRQANQAVIGAAEQLTKNSRANIPFAFSFNTQTLFEALPAAREVVIEDNAGLVNSLPAPVPAAFGHGPGDGNPLNGQTIEEFWASNLPQNLQAAPNAAIGSIYVGTVAVPQFRDNQLTDYWPTTPVKLSSRDVPFVLCLPDSTNFPGPRPVVIFQHGITTNKGVAFALANAFNNLGFAVISMDLPLHGGLKADPNGEDGDGFINPAKPRVSRDNLRQGAVGLYALNNAIFQGKTDLNGDGIPELVPGSANTPFNRPLFIGQSLGSMVGSLYVATEPNAGRAVLSVPGGRIINVLLTSPTFGPPILQGLAAVGIEPRTSDFTRFAIFTQAVLDDVDPLNYAQPAIAGTLRGGEGANILQQLHLDDTVITPEAQFDLGIAFGEAAEFKQVAALAPQALISQATAPAAGPGLFEVANAEHGALVNPAAGPTQQIVTQAITFLVSPTPAFGTIIDAGLRAAAKSDLNAPAVEDHESYRRAVSF